MRGLFITLAPMFLAGAATAQTGPAVSERVEIDMSSFKYRPSTIRLRHGQPYILHFVNSSHGSHDFVAKAFFDAARIAPADRAGLNKGEVELGGGESADVHLIAPAPGRYEAHCSHFMHSTFGMKATIVVS